MQSEHRHNLVASGDAPARWHRQLIAHERSPRASKEDATFKALVEDARRLIDCTHRLARSQRSSDHALARDTHTRLHTTIRAIAAFIESIDEIPDTRVRAVVAAAIERWRKQD